MAFGGGVGALTRYAVEGVVAPRFPGPFPLSTLVVNVSGSAALGVVAAVWGLQGPAAALAASGFLGAYTTFSTFTYETVRLLEDGAWGHALLNLLLSGPLSFAAAAAGYLLTRA